jgi:hypothetical protein
MPNPTFEEMDAAIATAIAEIADKILSVDFENDLAYAVSQIMAAQTVLTISEPTTVTAMLDVPRNIKINFVADGLISVDTNVVLTIGSMIDPGMRKVFDLVDDSTSHIYFLQNAISHFNTTWWSGNVPGGNLTVPLREALTQVATYGGGIIDLPQGEWELDNDVRQVNSAVKLRGFGRFSTAGTVWGTSLKLTEADSHAFFIGENTSNVSFEQFSIDGNGQENAVGILMQGEYPNSSFGIDINVDISGCVDGIFIDDSIGNAWQVENVRIGKCNLTNNAGSGFRCNTVNGSVKFDFTQIFVPEGAIGLFLEGAGMTIGNGLQFAGLSHPEDYCVAGVPNTILAGHCVKITGSLVGLTLIGCQDEGFQCFLEHAIADFYVTQINLIGNLIQAPIKFTNSSNCHIHAMGNKLYAKTFFDESGTSARVHDHGNFIFPTDICRVTVSPPKLDDFIGTSSFVVEQRSPQLYKFYQQLPQAFVQTDILGGISNTDPWIEILSSRPDKNLLRLGQCNDVGIPTGNHYDITRDGTNGFLRFDGSQTGYTGYQFNDGPIVSPPLRPAPITSNINDYDPGARGMYLFLSTDASREITGLTFAFQPQVDGQVQIIANVGSNALVLKHDVSSTPAYRFKNTTGSDITLAIGQMAFLIYDNEVSRWRVSKMN